MQNFSNLALKLREKIEDDGRMYCKITKFLKTPYGTKTLFMIFVKLEGLITILSNKI